MFTKKLLYLLALCFLLYTNSSTAEIIENKKVSNKSFGVWTVSCEDDEMLNEIDCRLFTEITGGTTIFVSPLSNENPVLISSKDAYYEKRMYVKVDNNKLIASQPINISKYGIINFTQSEMKALQNQIKNGSNLYIRFTIKDLTSPNGYREITVKVSLAEFPKALIYHNNQMNKYNFTINNIN